MNKLKALWRAYAAPCLAVLVALVLGINLLFAYLSQKNAFYPDLTPEELYQVSDQMVSLCQGLKGQVTVTFCDDPDRLLSRASTRYVYIMVQQLARKCDNIVIKEVNLDRDPTAVNAYRTTSATVIEADDVILSSGGIYRIYGADSFYTVSSEGDQNRFWSFNGEYKLATGLLSITALEQPYVYFAYGHGERIYVSPTDEAHAHLLPLSDEDGRAFYQLMLDQGLRVGYLNLDQVTEIPEDCALLVMDSPKTDYTAGDLYAHDRAEALDLIHDYLSRRGGAFMFFTDPAVSLPQTAELLAQWGIGLRDVTVRDTSSSLSADGGTLLGSFNTDENQMSYGVYTELVEMSSPPRLVIDGSGAMEMTWSSGEQSGSSTISVNGYYSPFFLTSDRARAYTAEGDLADQEAGVYHLAALSAKVRTDSTTGTDTYSYVFASASSAPVGNAWLSDHSYGNYDAFFALVRYISRTDVYASMELGGVSLNSSSLGGKPLEYSDMYTKSTNVYGKDGRLLRTLSPITEKTAKTLSMVLCLVPALTVLGACILVRLRRRHK